LKPSIKAAVLALVLALALPVAASAKTVVYGGTIDGTNEQGKIAFTVKTGKKSKPKAIKSMRFTGVPLTCDISGQSSTGENAVGGGEPIRVVKRKFAFFFIQEGSGLRSEVEGKFPTKKKLKGSMDYNWHYPEDPSFEPPLPEEDCHAQVTYSAKRGGPDVVLPQARFGGLRTR
jgi:hypothetical protein